MFNKEWNNERKPSQRIYREKTKHLATPETAADLLRTRLRLSHGACALARPVFRTAW